MKLKLLFTLLIVTISNAQTQIGQDIVGDMPDDKFGHGVALSADGNVMAVSAPGNDNNGTDAGHIRVYSKTSGTWTQIGQDIEGTNADDQIGYKIALSDDGTTLAFSTINKKEITPSTYYGNIIKIGSISIYKNVNGSWVQIGQELREDDPSPIFGQTSGFGLSLSLSSNGTTIAIGQNSPQNYNNKVVIYNFSSGNWTKIGEISAQTHQVGQSWGYYAWNVSISGDGKTVALSDITGHANGASSPEPGYVVAYKYMLGSWIKIGNTLSGKSTNIGFGHRVVLSNDGSVLAISSRSSSVGGAGSGHVEVYKIIGNNWVQIGNDIVGDAAKDFCGQGLAISANGNALAIGCTGCDTANGTDTGKVRVFENVQGNWVEKGSVIGANAGDKIGWSIALSKDGYNLAVGNPGSSSVGGKPFTTNFEKETVNDNLLETNNYQAKGTFPGSVQVFNLSGILSSDEFVLENFNIYPNPTTDILNIELKENLTLDKVLIYNTNGQLVKETTEKTINVGGFAKGIYNVQVLTKQGKATKKVIIK